MLGGAQTGRALFERSLLAQSEVPNRTDRYVGRQRSHNVTLLS